MYSENVKYICVLEIIRILVYQYISVLLDIMWAENELHTEQKRQEDGQNTP